MQPRELIYLSQTHLCSAHTATLHRCSGIGFSCARVLAFGALGPASAAVFVSRAVPGNSLVFGSVSTSTNTQKNASLLYQIVALVHMLSLNITSHTKILRSRAGASSHCSPEQSCMASATPPCRSGSSFLIGALPRARGTSSIRPGYLPQKMLEKVPTYPWTLHNAVEAGTRAQPTVHQVSSPRRDSRTQKEIL